MIGKLERKDTTVDCRGNVLFDSADRHHGNKAVSASMGTHLGDGRIGVAARPTPPGMIS